MEFNNGQPPLSITFWSAVGEARFFSWDRRASAECVHPVFKGRALNTTYPDVRPR